MLRLQQLNLYLFFCISFSLLTACVSVQLPGSENKKSKGVNILEPSSPFQKIDLAGADEGWKSQNTGNTISYYSDCSNLNLSLERQREDTLTALPQSQVLSSQLIQHDNREALLTEAEGSLEGIPMQMIFVNYTKNACRYTLTYAGRKTKINQERSVFEKFKTGFHAP